MDLPSVFQVSPAGHWHFLLRDVSIKVAHATKGGNARVLGGGRAGFHMDVSFHLFFELVQ